MAEQLRICAYVDELGKLMHTDTQRLATDIALTPHAPAQSALDELRREVAHLKTVMIAAAEEIHDHWDAHCDAEGYGPANLMRRLELGIPAVYGYTAGAFERLRREVEALRADRDRLTHEELADAIIRDVGELPDYTSPDDWPDTLMATAGELRTIILGHLSGERGAR